MNFQTRIVRWGRFATKQDMWSPGETRINRLYYIHSGEAYYTINGIRSQLLPGYLYVLPETMRILVSIAEGATLDHTFFDFDVVPGFSFQHVVCLEVQKHPLIRTTMNLIHQLFQTLRSSVSSMNWRADTIDNMNHLLSTLLWVISLTEELAVTNDARILNTLFYIQENLHTELAVKTLSDRLFLEKCYFIRLFTKETGLTPHQYIIRRKMNHALSLLEKGLSSREVAERCGFENYSTFSRAYKNFYGYPPTEQPKIWLSYDEVNS